MNKKNRMSLADEEKIIDFVKNNEVLFNVRHPKFRDTEGKNRLWIKLADKLNVEGMYISFFFSLIIVKHSWRLFFFLNLSILRFNRSNSSEIILEFFANY